jgi:hypothetical protein
MESEKEERIYLHNAKLITDNKGYIYNPDVLTLVNIGHIVRISFEVDFIQIKIWSHDSPYVKVLLKNTDGSILGEIENINRLETGNYPLSVGERIWFRKENIIEIPSDNNLYNTYLTKDKVTATGPLYTIESDIESDSETESDSNSYSCSDSD